MFCAGANIAMLGQSSHEQKVNFCKFTNETRNAIEDASRHSGQTYFCVWRPVREGIRPVRRWPTSWTPTRRSSTPVLRRSRSCRRSGFSMRSALRTTRAATLA